MSTHPNVILLCTITPDGTTRKTLRAMQTDAGEAWDEGDQQFTIGGEDYHVAVMESDYNENWQLSGQEGDILVFNLVTYGYGEQIDWDKLVAQRNELVAFAESVCAKHHCAYRIAVAANYW